MTSFSSTALGPKNMDTLCHNETHQEERYDDGTVLDTPRNSNHKGRPLVVRAWVVENPEAEAHGQYDG
jgi:hypothetical protein